MVTVLWMRAGRGGRKTGISYKQSRPQIKRTTKQKMARQHNREGGEPPGQESNRQTTMEDIDGGLHPTVDGQSLDKDEDEEPSTTDGIPDLKKRLHFCLLILLT